MISRGLRRGRLSKASAVVLRRVVPWTIMQYRSVSSTVSRMMHPVLYSFRRCPYAIRTRMALLIAGQMVVVREVLLREKPCAMLTASSKGTVPVLVMPDGGVLEESIDIMHWALRNADDPALLSGRAGSMTVQQALVDRNDREFKHWLDRYKYHVRFPQAEQLYYRRQAETFLQLLESHLCSHRFLFADEMLFADVALMPFVRQFAAVEPQWFDQCDYNRVRGWLNRLTSTAVFKRAMKKQIVWDADNSAETQFLLNPLSGSMS